MKWLRDLKIGTKLTIVATVLMLFIGVVGYVGFKGVKEVKGLMEGIYNQNYGPSVNIANLKSNMNEVRVALLTMMAANDKAKMDEQNEHIKELREDIAARLSELTKSTSNEKVKTLKEVIVAFRDTRDKEVIPLIYEGKIQEAKALATGIQAERFKKIVSISNELIDEAKNDAEKAIQNGTNTYENSKNVLITVIVLAILIGGLLSFVLASMITKPITKAVNLAEAIANGDLTQKIDVSMLNREDEIGHLMKSLDKMSHSLNEFISSVVSSSTRIASASEELSASATQIAKGSQSQTEKATTVAASAEEMSATVIEVAKNASGASESAKESNKLAQKGKTTVERTIEGMNGMAQSVEESASVITQLGTRSNEIGEIIKVIDDIADQTNLLALNAAIEAARAGEHGRGFAVVADEVRKLAEKTTKATKEIGGMIGTIQAETGKAVQSMGEVTKEVGEEVKQAKDAGDALNEIAANVDKLNSMIQQIAVASEEQSAATDTISKDIQDIANTTKETSTSSTQIADASNDLAKLATELQGMLAKFKVRSS